MNLVIKSAPYEVGFAVCVVGCTVIVSLLTDVTDTLVGTGIRIGE
jgi:hypothetical protein